jgi:protein-S-isoprenylcysteine O-methyltransferase Ste14
MYTGIVIVVAGLLVRTPSLVPFLVGLALVAMLVTKARFEEQLLRARYPGYDAYRARTWGVIAPRL